MIGIVVPTEPLAVATGEPLIFELGFDATELHMLVWRSNQGEVIREPSDDAFAWQHAGSEEPVLEETPPPGRTFELRHDLPPGTYIVQFGGRAAGGSAAYGFHLEIVP
jgi:hypothetical protein